MAPGGHSGAVGSVLGFTHRDWCHAVGGPVHVKALFRTRTRHLQIDTVHDAVKEGLRDINSDLDAGALRRQAKTG